MTRAPVSLLGGVALALALFWLLALLVAPPEADIEVLEPTTMSLVEAEAPAEQTPVEAATTPPPPPPAPVAPPPLPEPTPLAESPIALPEPELPALEAPPVELDETLPELVEQRPEPKPQPEPKPRPEPEPQREPAREPVAATTSSDTAVAETVSKASVAAEEPVDVGSPTPTNRVPPDYPARAQRRGLEGHVELTFVIRPDGSVDPGSIQVVEARPRNVFDRAARQAVARWQFTQGKGLRRARQRLEFQLR